MSFRHILGFTLSTALTVPQKKYKSNLFLLFFGLPQEMFFETLQRKKIGHAGKCTPMKILDLLQY